MADIYKFPTRQADVSRREFNEFIKKGASFKDWNKLIEGKSDYEVAQLEKQRNKIFPTRYGNPMNRPETPTKGYGPTGISYAKGMNTEIKPTEPIDNRPKSSDLKPRYQMSPDEFNKHIDTQVKRKILRTSKDLPLVIEGGGSQPKQKVESAKKVGGGIKWGTAAKIAGKALGGVVGVAAEIAFPTQLNVGEDEWLRKQRNTYANKVSLGILD